MLIPSALGAEPPVAGQPARGAGSSPGPSRGVLARLWPLLAISAAFLAGAVVTWGRVGELVVDTGRELDVPRRLLAGEQLYRDVRWYYGPLAPWVNTELYRWFGVHVDVLAGAGLVSAALLTAVLYLLARRFADRLVSVAAAIAFLGLGAFASGCGFAICNFVLPYTFGATYGMLAAAAALLFLVRHAQDGRPGDFLASAAFLALAALAKLEPLAPALTAHLVFAIGAVWTRRLRSWPHAAGWAGAAAAVSACYAVLAIRSGGAVWADNLRALANPASGPFIAWSMGMDDPLRSALRAARSVAVLGAVVAAVALVARLGRSAPPAVARCLPLAIGAAAFAASYAQGVGDAFRGLPLVMVAVLVALAHRWVRSPESRADGLPRLLLWSAGLAALGRIVLHVNLDVYGFYLLPIGLVCVATLLSTDVPRVLRCGAPCRGAFAAAAVGVLFGAGADAARISRAELASRTVEVVTPRGTMRLPPRERAVAEMVSALLRLPRGARLLVLPEGAGVSFFAGLEAADPYSSHLPMEFPDDAADRALLARLGASPPDYVLVLPRDTREFGYAGFGRDYAVRTGEWITRGYRPTFATHPAVVLLARSAPP